jgi:pimeloyl-ACP methyl ester carboxylesterase
MMTVNYPYTTHTIELQDCNIAYIDEGSGPKVLLFIHGLAMFAPCWQKNIEYLKHHYRCIAIDLPGNGLSSRGDYPYGIAFFADTIYEFIQNLKLKEVCIVGHSMGGQIAMATLIRHSACADQLILCAPAGFEQFSPFEKTIYHTSLHLVDMFSTEENSLRHVTEMSFYHKPHQANELVNELIRIMHAHPIKEYCKMIEGCILGMVNEPVYEKLHYILQPTLIIFGENDALIPNKLIHHISTAELAETAARKLPGAELHLIRDCGHFLQWEKAEEVNKLIMHFLS